MLNISDPGESINEYLLFGIAFFFGLSRGGGGEGSGRGGCGAGAPRSSSESGSRCTEPPRLQQRVPLLTWVEFTT